MVFGPLIRTSYRTFSSHISTPTQDLLSKWTGASSSSGNTTDPIKEKSAGYDKEDYSLTAQSLHSKPSDDLEMGKYHVVDPVPAVPWHGVGGNDRLSRDQSGMAVNQHAALANLDPRAGATDGGVGEKAPMGTSASAAYEQHGGRGVGLPGHKIGVSTDYKLERE